MVRDCDRCTVQLVHAVTGQADHVWTSHVRRVGSDHQITFGLRTALTHGLSFVVEAPWAGNIGAVPNMVTRYPGHKVGTVLDRSDARARHASRGLLGRDRRRQRPADVPGGPRQRAHARRSPDQDAPGLQPPARCRAGSRTVRTYKGTIGNQDAFYCTRP